MENYKAVIRSKDSGSTKFLLKNGMIPGIIYGKGTKSLKIAFENKVLNKLMYAGGFYSKIINKICILLDDIADSAGTLFNAAMALKKNGAKEIYSYVVHGVLSKDAVEKIKNSDIKELVLTDSIQATEKVKNTKNIRHISIAPLMGEAIKRINSNSSVSALFD